MGVIHPHNAPDAVEHTLEHIPRFAWEDIEPDLQDYPAALRLLRRNKHAWESGDEWKWEIMVDTNSPARHTSLFKTTPTDVGPLMQSAKIPMKFCETYISFDDREDMFSKGTEKVYDVIGSRTYDARKDLIKLVETDFWECPTDQSSDDELEKPYGISCWILIATTTSSGSFAGGNHTAFSSGIGGISRTDYPNLKNWNAGYAALTSADAIKKLRRAYRFTNFRAPVKHKRVGGADRKFNFFTTYDNLTIMEDLLTNQNDNLGNDLAAKDGHVLFRGREVEDVPYLQDNCTSSAHTYLGLNPIFGLNWSKVFPVMKSGYWFTWGELQRSATQNHVFNKFMDVAYNIVNVNPREGGFVLNQL